jgi:Ca2+-binding EF-hand superfamily protein
MAEFHVVLTEDEIAGAKQGFDLFDTDSSGSISFEELKQVQALQQFPDSDEKVNEMMKGMDADGNGEISYDEFLAFMLKQKTAHFSQVKASEDQDEKA